MHLFLFVLGLGLGLLVRPYLGTFTYLTKAFWKFWLPAVAVAAASGLWYGGPIWALSLAATAFLVALVLAYILLALTSPPMTNYVLGFRFRNDDTEVALISKLTPAWMAGKLNGIGGKIERADHMGNYPDNIEAAASIAMSREFEEETGVATSPFDWHQFGVLNHNGHFIYLFVSHGPCNLQHVEQERPRWYPVGGLSLCTKMRNLDWLIPLALDKDKVTAYLVDDSAIPA